MCFYLYRDNYRIKVGEGDDQLEQKLQSQGYELFTRPLPTREEAETQQMIWQGEVDQRRQAGLF